MLLLVGFIMLGSIVYVALDPEVSGLFLDVGRVSYGTRFFPPQRPYDFRADFGIDLMPGGRPSRPLDYGDFAIFGAAGFILAVPPLFHFYRYRKWKTKK